MFLFGCCICFTHMLQVFLSGRCVCFAMAFQVLLHVFQTYVLSVSSVFKCMLQKFYLYISKVDRVLYMLQYNSPSSYSCWGVVHACGKQREEHCVAAGAGSGWRSAGSGVGGTAAAVSIRTPVLPQKYIDYLGINGLRRCCSTTSTSPVSKCICIYSILYYKRAKELRNNCYPKVFYPSYLRTIG